MRLEYVLTDIQELSFSKKISGETQIDIAAKTDYNVYYAEDGNSCIGEFYAEFVSEGNHDQFQIKYRSKSLFNLHDVELNDSTKRKIHVEIYHRIFPMCNETLKSFTALSGVPGLSLPMMDIENMEIIVNS